MAKQPQSRSLIDKDQTTKTKTKKEEKNINIEIVKNHKL